MIAVYAIALILCLFGALILFRDTIVSKNFKIALDVVSRESKELILTGRGDEWKIPFEEYCKYSYDKIMFQVWKWTYKQMFPTIPLN